MDLSTHQDHRWEDCFHTLLSVRSPPCDLLVCLSRLDYQKEGVPDCQYVLPDQEVFSSPGCQYTVYITPVAAPVLHISEFHPHRYQACMQGNVCLEFYLNTVMVRGTHRCSVSIRNHVWIL